MKKIIFVLILFLSCYIVYNLTNTSKVYYLALGDSISKGINIYGANSYGYTYYVRDYLKDNNRLEEFNGDYTDGDYRITDLISMIRYNDVKNINGKDISINRLLKKADIITLSIGINELYYKLGSDDVNIYSYMNDLIDDMDVLLTYINQFNHKKVFVLGYYNISDYQEEVDYINNKLRELVINQGFEYVDLSKIFDNNPSFFDKKNNFIPNNDGYLKISKIIVEKLENY